MNETWSFLFPPSFCKAFFCKFLEELLKPWKNWKNWIRLQWNSTYITILSYLILFPNHFHVYLNCTKFCVNLSCCLNKYHMDFISWFKVHCLLFFFRFSSKGFKDKLLVILNFVWDWFHSFYEVLFTQKFVDWR